MEKKNKLRYLLLLFSVMFVSCASKKDIIYLQDLVEGDELIHNKDFRAPKFKIDDRLTINMSSVNPEVVRPYNLYVTGFNTGGISSVGQQQQQSYLVDQNGEISFPQLGKIEVVGKTRVELEAYLEEKIKLFVPDVKANVQLVNFRISVLGEVQSPGEFTINREKVSILQAIGLAGDLTIHGKRNDVKLIRETDKHRVVYSVDLRSKSILESPAYYLQQNDVVYISPNKQRVNAAASSPTATYIISATGLLITIISILTK